MNNPIYKEAHAYLDQKEYYKSIARFYEELAMHGNQKEEKNNTFYLENKCKEELGIYISIA